MTASARSPRHPSRRLSPSDTPTRSPSHPPPPLLRPAGSSSSLPLHRPTNPIYRIHGFGLISRLGSPEPENESFALPEPVSRVCACFCPPLASLALSLLALALSRLFHSLFILPSPPPPQFFPLYSPRTCFPPLRIISSSRLAGTTPRTIDSPSGDLLYDTSTPRFSPPLPVCLLLNEARASVTTDLSPSQSLVAFFSPLALFAWPVDSRPANRPQRRRLTLPKHLLSTSTTNSGRMSAGGPFLQSPLFYYTSMTNDPYGFYQQAQATNNFTFDRSPPLPPPPPPPNFSRISYPDQQEVRRYSRATSFPACGNLERGYRKNAGGGSRFIGLHFRPLGFCRLCRFFFNPPRTSLGLSSSSTLWLTK